MPTAPVARFATLAAAVAIALALTGCRGIVKTGVPITGAEMAPDSRPAIDVSNYNGSVRVVVDDDIQKASVRARVRRLTKKVPKGEGLAAQTFLAAETVVQDGRTILRVVSETRLANPDDSRADLTIRLPSCGGVLVRNSGGPVELRGVGGAITVENGIGNRSGGWVIVRTQQVLTDPIHLSTTNGKVHLQGPPGSTGSVDIHTDDGAAVMYAMGGVLAVEKAETGHFVGTLNSGENPVTIRTGKGRAEIYIIDSAGSYRPTRR